MAQTFYINTATKEYSKDNITWYSVSSFKTTRNATVVIFNEQEDAIGNDTYSDEVMKIDVTADTLIVDGITTAPGTYTTANLVSYFQSVFPKAGASALTTAQQFKRDGYSVIGTLTAANRMAPLPASIAGGRSFRSYHDSLANASKIIIVYANWITNGYGEYPNTNPIVIGASLQKFGANVSDQTPTRIPSTFSGRLKGVCEGDALLYSDPISFSVSSLERFFINTYYRYSLPPAAPDVTATTSTSGGSIAASQTVFVVITYIYLDGSRSNPSTPQSITTGAGSSNSITVPAPAASGSAVGWSAWITAGGQANTSYFFLAGFTGDFTTPLVIISIPGTSSKLPSIKTTVQGPTSTSLLGGTTSGDIGINSGEGWNTGETIYNGQFNFQEAVKPGIIPVLIIGKVDKATKSLGGEGDSIMDGGGNDTGLPQGRTGFFVRACTNQLSLKLDLSIKPLVAETNMAQSSEHLYEFADTYKSSKRLLVLEWFTNWLCEYITNDIADGRTLAQAKADTLTVAAMATVRGIKFFKTTMLPRVTTTDGASTVANQTLPAYESVRIAYNAWLRDTGPNGFIQQSGTPSLVAVCDLCKNIEVNASNVLTQDGGRWRVGTVTVLASGSVTGGASNSQFTDSTKNFTRLQYQAYVLKFTSGTQAGTQRQILNTDGQNIYWIGSSAYPTAPANGDTYQILSGVYTLEGTHPTSEAHILLAQTVQQDVFPYMI